MVGEYGWKQTFGSMTGWKMVAARRAAARIVDTLTSGDRFAVLTFDDRIDHPAGLPDGLVEATDNGWKATDLGGRFLNDLQASFLA